MPYTVRLKSSAERELKRLAKQGALEVAGVIDSLRDQPRPPGTKPIKGRQNTYRIRKGDFRIIYTVDDTSRIVRIVKVADRKDVYRKR